jgi:hypothetical protein
MHRRAKVQTKRKWGQDEVVEEDIITKQISSMLQASIIPRKY